MRTTWHVNDILRTINEGLHVNEALLMQINDRILFFILSRMYWYIHVIRTNSHKTEKKTLKITRDQFVQMRKNQG